MTKKEWFSRLRNFIQGMPQEEQRRIFDYYEELYADKRESGMSEWDIIAEFGNPQEVAGKMLTEMSTLHSEDTDYRAPATPACRAEGDRRESASPRYGAREEHGTAQSQYGAQPNAAQPPYGAQTQYAAQPQYAAATPPTPEKRKFSFGRLLVFIFLLIPCGAILFALIFAGWAAFLALTVSGVVVAIGGGGSAVYTLVTAFDGSTWLAYAGAGLALVGAGIGLTCICSRLMGVFWKLTGKLCKSFYHFVFRRVKA